MAIAFALACAGVYGSADFLGGLAARRVSAIAVVVWSQAVGLAVLLPALAIGGGAPTGFDLAWGAACGVAGGFAVALLYRALAIGTMGVVSPITAVLAAVLPVAFALVRGERLAPLVFVGIAAALVAVVCVSAAPNEHAGARRVSSMRLPPGVVEALGAGTLFGLLFIALAQTHAAAGMVPLLVARAVSIVVVGGATFALRRPALRIQRSAARTIVLAGVLDVSANVLYVLAAHIGPLAIAAVLTSLYPAATVALAAIVVRERLGRVQWIGVAIALASVAMIATR